MGNKGRLHTTYEKYLKQCGHYAGEVTSQTRGALGISDRQRRLLDLTKRIGMGRELLHKHHIDQSKVRNQERTHRDAVRDFMRTGDYASTISRVSRIGIMKEGDALGEKIDATHQEAETHTYLSDVEDNSSSDNDRGDSDKDTDRLADAMRGMENTFSVGSAGLKRRRAATRAKMCPDAHRAGPPRKRRRRVDEEVVPRRTRHLHEGTCVQTPLYLHQRIAVAWLMLRERLPFREPIEHGSILADDMGLGKTLTTIALVDTCRVVDRTPTLVVVPASLVDTWISQCRQHAPQMAIRAIKERNIVDVNGRPIASSRLGNTVPLCHWTMRRDIATVMDADMVIISYDKLRSAWYSVERTLDLRMSRSSEKSYLREHRHDSVRKHCLRYLTSDTQTPESAETISSFIFTVCWQRVVLDECTKVKNGHTKIFAAVNALSCRSITALSGTPVENTVEDLRSYLRLMRTSSSKNEDDDQKTPIDSRSAWIQFVDSSDRSGRRLTPDGIGNLHRQFLDVVQLSRSRRDSLRVNPLKLYLARAARARDAGDDSEDATPAAVPAHFYPNLSDEDMAENVASVSKTLRLAGLPSVADISVEAMRRQRASEAASGVASGWTRRDMVLYAPMHQEEASVVETAARELDPRGKSAKSGGIRQWQLDIGAVSDYRDFVTSRGDVGSLRPPTKFQMMARYVRACGRDERVVVFSKRIHFFGRLKTYLEHELRDLDVRCVTYTGFKTDADKKRAVDLFRKPVGNGGARVMLMSSGCGAFGLNELVVANHAVIYNADFNPTTDEQCIGRVDRSGQRKSVVYAAWLCVHKSVDERINESFVTKKELITHVTHGTRTNTDTRVSVYLSHPVDKTAQTGETVGTMYAGALERTPPSKVGTQIASPSRSVVSFCLVSRFFSVWLIACLARCGPQCFRCSRRV